MKKYILGLDLGISSVGWAVTGYDDENAIEPWLDDFGVRLFEVPENPKDKTSLAAERRGFRSSRRLKRRKKARIKLLKKILIDSDIINESSYEKTFNFSISSLKPTNKIVYDEKKYFNPYVIRKKGLKEKLSSEELTIALVHIAKNRGFENLFDPEKGEDKSELKDDAKINEKEDYANSIIIARKLIGYDIATKTCKKTIAEAFIGEESSTRFDKNKNLLNVRNKDSQYRFLFPRAAYKYELELILNKQAEYYPQLNNEIIDKIMDTILRQRFFEDGFGPKNISRAENIELIKQKLSNIKDKNNHYIALRDSLRAYKLYKPFTELVGNCTFFPNEKRYIKSSIIFDLYQMAVEVSKFSSFLENKQTIKDFHNKLFNLALTDEKFILNNKKQIESVLKTDFGVKSEDLKNLKALDNAKKTDLFGFTKRFIKVFGMEKLKELNIDNLDSNIIDNLGDILNKNITPELRKSNIKKWASDNNVTINDENINQLLLTPSKVTTTSNLCKKAMLMVIKHFLEGEIAGVYQDELKAKANEYTDLNIKKFLQPIVDGDLVRNPVVFRAINEARKVLKALFRKYNDFEKINVETSRELGKSGEVRNELNKKNLDSRAKNEVIKSELEKIGIVVNTTSILKYKLWLAQDKKCLYSLRDIKIEQLNSHELEVDHILPISKFPDDSFDNKVLVYTTENQLKKNRTPLEYFNAENPEIINSYKKNCLDLYRKGNITWNKYENLLLKSVLDIDQNKFSSRNLVDNSYIARYFANWLKNNLIHKYKKENKEYKSNVLMIKGVVTSRFRRKWLRFSPWGLDIKVRDITPFHHAVDAIVLSQFKNQGSVDFASDLIAIENEFKSFKYKNISLEQYRNNVKEICSKWHDNSGYQWQFQISKPIERIDDFINSNCQAIKMFPLVKKLDKLIDLRMPIELSVKVDVDTVKLTEKELKRNFKNLNELSILNEKDFKKEIKVKRPVFVKVKYPQEYIETLKNANVAGDIHYPFVSYKVNHKVSGSVTSSQLMVSKKSLKDSNRDQFHTDKHGNLWETNVYYGVIIDKEGINKPRWIKKIDVFKNKNILKLRDNEMILRQNDTVFYKNKDDNYEYKVFKSKMGSQIYATRINTTYISSLEKNKEIFGTQNYYDSLSNIIKEVKIVVIDILGKA